MRNIIIFGASDFAQLMYYYLKFESDSNNHLVGFCVHGEFLKEKEFCGIPVYPFEDIEKKFPTDKHNFLVAVGYSNMRYRKKVFDEVKKKGYRMINYIHPSVRIRNVSIGENNIFLEGVIIEPFVNMGDNNTIWSKSLLCHNLKMGSHNYVAPGCIVGAGCDMGDLCFFGSSVATVNSIDIKDETYLVAGSVLLKSSMAHSMYRGNPAVLTRTHEEFGIKIKKSYMPK
ncbi:sugar O-acyltransferase (sialic acid O-acetyltransferase NeuD family) [Pseudomonas duriflava]|uniref:Sugar O-acyltransferase (Sialic acid O-acetyltransferase NeuD family) n=1 Tax=Pseudomonas duriflava TaxID=459528 RepID=A0A562QC26_9PSED|nr:acetyltransferase [Pseudomonas duriflava]TWI53576.1 sugar O-acyltransferase (sialic acid O-acetyltransferase NeuD family) [Pseudomonas duriflava]